MKQNINQAQVLAFHNLHKPFKVDTNANDYAMGAFLMQGSKPICYHYEMFHGGVLNYPTYNKELYTLVQIFKKWKHYIMVKKTIIHIDHQPI
jgi:hypothetical protein